MAEIISQKDFDGVISNALFSYPAKFTRQEAGEVVAYVLLDAEGEIGRITLAPMTPAELADLNLYLLGNGKSPVPPALRAAMGFTSYQCPASVQGERRALYGRISHFVRDELQRRIGDLAALYANWQKAEQPAAQPQPSAKQETRGRRGFGNKAEKAQAVRDWDSLPNDTRPRLTDWLEAQFGSNPTTGTLIVPESTFHGWRKHLNS